MRAMVLDKHSTIETELTLVEQLKGKGLESDD
jgi:hypothetical protein